MHIETPESLLAYWIGDAADNADAAAARSKLWFKKSFDTDREIAERFGDTLSALAGGLAFEWAVKSPRARLAAIIAFDQFPRNMFRGTPAAFEFDGRALDLCTHGILLAEDMGLKPTERRFFYMPLEHSEQLSDQELSVKAFGGALHSAPDAFKPMMQDALDYAERHHDAIARFGRFPHRNKILGRTSTADELAWLEQHGGF
ncbi:MAG: DUF924 family protein [Hyphomonadaceae bacterium]